MDAGIFVERTAKNARIENNFIHGQGFGVWVDATHNVSILNNKIQGDVSLRNQDRGNGIHLFAVRFANIMAMKFGKPAMVFILKRPMTILFITITCVICVTAFITFSNRNEVTYNRTERTRTGYALMQSRQLTVTDNTSDHDQNYGLLMNYITYSTLKIICYCCAARFR